MMEFELEINYTDMEVIKILDSELSNIEDLKFEKVSQNGFDGLDILFYFIATGGATLIIKSIKEIIIKTIERNDVKSFKINNIECKGFSEKEILVLLEKANILSNNKPGNKQK